MTFKALMSRKEGFRTFVPLSQWEKIKKAGMAPGARSGFVWAPHKRKAVLFGGVTDNEARMGEVMASEFHNELYQFNFDKRRWFPVTMRSPAGKGKRAGEGTCEEAGRGAVEAGISGKGNGTGVFNSVFCVLVTVSCVFFVFCMFVCWVVSVYLRFRLCMDIVWIFLFGRFGFRSLFRAS